MILTGLVQFVKNSDKITATPDYLSQEPAFTTQVLPGDQIKLPTDSSDYWTTVKSVISDSELLLTKPYLGSNGSSDYVTVLKNEIKEYLYKKIPQVYHEEIPSDEFDTVLNVISSAYLELFPKIKEMKYLMDVDLSDEKLLPYIGYLMGFQFDESMGAVSSFLQQPILKRNQVKNAVAWQKLKGSIFGIKQYLKTLAIEATIKELWYDHTFRNLLDSQYVVQSVSELWQKDIINNSIQLFSGNNGIDTSNINHLVSSIVDGNLIYTPVINGSIKAELWTQVITNISGTSTLIQNSTAVTGVGTLYLSEVSPGDKFTINTPSYMSWGTSTAYFIGTKVMHLGILYECMVSHTSNIFTDDLISGYWAKRLQENNVWYIVDSISSDTSIILTTVATTGKTATAKIVKPTKFLRSAIRQDANNNFIYDGANAIPINLGKATIKGNRAELFDIQATQNILRVKVNGGIEQIITITVPTTPGSGQSAGVVVNDINNQLSGAIAYGEDGRVVIQNQSNDIYSTLEIVNDPNTAHIVLGFNLGIVRATTNTMYDGDLEYLQIELLSPTDFSITNGEILVYYDYLNATAPVPIQEYDYKTGAKSNWFDIQIQPTNNSFILLSDDVEKIVNKIKTDVKPFHALLRTIRYVSGFEDSWQYQADQPSFFKDWRESFRGDINGAFQEIFRFGFSSCTCQCCLLYDSCIQKIYDGKLNYSFLTGIYYDSETCIPRDLLVVYDGFISNYGSSTLPTHVLAGTVTLTNGLDTISGSGTSFDIQLLPGYLLIIGSVFYRVKSVTDAVTAALEYAWDLPTVSLTNVDAINFTTYTKYVYNLNYVSSNIQLTESRLIVYYDGRKYSNDQKTEWCIFHYDLGEFPKIISLNDEDYDITPTTNSLQIKPLRVKEISGYISWSNGLTAVTGIDSHFTTELTAGVSLIKPSQFGTTWYLVNTITDDFNLDLSVAWPGSNLTDIITDVQMSSYTTLSISLTPGLGRTAEDIADEINYRIGQQSISDGIILNATFTNGSNLITGSGSNFTICKTGDWIKPIAGIIWYQIDYVIDTNNIVLTTNIIDPTVTSNGDKSTPIVMSWGIPSGTLTGFVRLLAQINIDTTTGSKGALSLEPVANDAYTVFGFDKLYSKTSACYMLYNPNPNITLSVTKLNGDVTMTNGSSAVSGSPTGHWPTFIPTAFNTQLKVGDLMKLSTGTNSQWSYVSVVVDDFNATLDGTYQGITGTDSDVNAIRNAYNTRLTGTVSFTNGLTGVTGVGTKFLTEVDSGDFIRLPGDIVWGTVLTVVDNLNITLTAVYGGSTGSALGTTRLVKTSNFVLGSNFVDQDKLLLALQT